MGDITQAKSSDPMLAVLGQTGTLEELKEERISLQLARGRCYDILSSAFSYPWNRKFFRPKSLLEPMDCLLYTSPSPRDGLLSRMPSSA